MGEFDLIDRHFRRPTLSQPLPPGVPLGIGDDCALLAPALGMQLAVSTDMLVAGRHFFPEVDPFALGHKALAVNLSDLAAMGAQPLAFTLALSLPNQDDAWLAALSRGMLALAQAHGCALVGGDTTAGPLNLCLTVFGEVPAHDATRRDAARVGDDIYVSGTLGDARLALEGLLGHWPVAAETLASARVRLERPTPRVALGVALRGLIHACADVSDGLLADLGHIMKASGVSATLDVDGLLESTAVSDRVRALPPAQAWTCVLAGGDDYELVFTAPVAAREAVAAAAQQAGIPVTRIGRVVAAQGGDHTAHLCRPDGSAAVVPPGALLGGFDHFARAG